MSPEQLGLEAATTLAICAAVGVVAVVISDLAARRILLPAVVLEIVGGILVGPDVLGLAQDNVIVSAFSELGLVMLMFLAGYEIQADRIKGAPLRSALVGWAGSLVLGLAAGITLVSVTRPEDGLSSGIIVGLIFTTTALGTVLPILRDSGDLETRFGTLVLSAGAVGEFGPIVAVALLLSGDSLRHTDLRAPAVRRRRRPGPLGSGAWAFAPRLLTPRRTLGSSGQLGVRWSCWRSWS